MSRSCRGSRSPTSAQASPGWRRSTSPPTSWTSSPTATRSWRRSASLRGAATPSAWRPCERQGSTTRPSAGPARTRCCRPGCERAATASARHQACATSSRSRPIRTPCSSSSATQSSSGGSRPTSWSRTAGPSPGSPARRRARIARAAQPCGRSSSWDAPPGWAWVSPLRRGGAPGRQPASSWRSVRQVRALLPYLRHLRFGPVDIAALGALQPALDVAYSAGFVKGLTRVARRGEGTIS